MNRTKLIILWAACTAVMPILSVAMFCHAAFGSEERAKSMAVAQDECGNALFGGPPQQTISTRVGNGLIDGKCWAKVVAPFIDFFFGEGHCLSNATITDTNQ